MIISPPPRDEFLTAIFEGRAPDEHVSLGCRKPGTKYWGYAEWKPGTEPATPICYYSPVTVAKPPRARRLSAKSEFRQTCHTIVLDDVGSSKSSKVPTDAIKLPPSYILETSLGNFQYGYILKTPLPVSEADAIIRGLIDAELTDKGRTNLSAHVMRVPGSLNDKYDVPFHAKMVTWSPDKRFTGEALSIGLGAVPRDVDHNNLDRVNPLADGAVDPIFELLVANGRILGGPNAAGWYPTICPRDGEHTTGSLGVDYKPGSPGAFKCLHAHGAEIPTRVFVGHLEKEFPGARDILKAGVDSVRASLTTKTQTIPTVDGHLHTITPPFFIDMTKSKLFPDPTGEKQEMYYAQVFERRDRKKQTAEFLETDLVHVNIEGAYYSFSMGGFVQYRSLNATFAPHINDTGFLDYVDDNGKSRRLSMGKWLANNKHVISVARAVSRPGEGRFIGNAVNIAPAFPVPEIPPEVMKDGIGAVQPFVDLLTHVIGDEGHVDHFLDWAACIVTDVNTKPGHAVVISSQVHGVGKNLISGTIGMVVGREYSTTVSQTVLQSQFNPYDAKRWVVLNETRTTSRGSATLHDIEGKMKVSLSNDGEDIIINDKNTKHYAAKNISCWYCTSNETVPFQLDKHDRRLFVVESRAEKLSTEKAIAYIAWRKEHGVRLVGGYLRLRWETMSEERRSRVTGAAPMTAAKEDLIELGDNSLAGAIREVMRLNTSIYWPEVMSFDDMMLSIREGFPRSGLVSPGAIASLNTRKVQVALREYGATRLKHVKLDDHSTWKSLWLLSHDAARIRYWTEKSPAALRRAWQCIRDSRPGEKVEDLLKQSEAENRGAKVFKIHFSNKSDDSKKDALKPSKRTPRSK